MNGRERTVVELAGVTLSFGARKVLKGVDIQVTSQDRLVVLGQSGSGKSTILRLVLGILKPDSGAVKFRGFSLTNPTQEPARG